MPALVLTFPGRRYHATPWGHHVNEGLIEWPPSPWRLLRALLAVGYSTLGWDGDITAPWRSRPPSPAASLLEKLANVLPRYRLPAAVGTHTRHFMPKLGFDDPKDKTLVFDTWAHIDAGELWVHWPLELSTEEHAMMTRLASRLSYLGRSESWVVARWVADDQAALPHADVCPCHESPKPGPDWDQIALLAPEPVQAYEAWRTRQLQQALANLPLPEAPRKPPKSLLNQRDKLTAPYPETLLACLQTDTTWQRSHGWSQPPGSRKVLYWRRADAIATRAVQAGPQPRPETTVSFVLLGLATEHRNLHALPGMARSLPQGEMLHEQLVGGRNRLSPGAVPSVLTGQDSEGRPLGGAHRHAHLLSLDLDGDGHIDHLLAWAPAGLDNLDQQALRMARGTYTKGGTGRLALTWAASGEREDLLQLAEPFGTALRRAIGRSCTWTSVTPFVPPRFLKRSGRNTLVGQVQAELASRGLPAAVEVLWRDPQFCDLARRQRHFVRRRRRGPQPPADQSFTLVLRFAEPVEGPLCLGYGSHFGLGRFEAENDRA